MTEYLNLTVDGELKKEQNKSFSDFSDPWGNILGKRKVILKLLAGGEYNVKMVAEAFGIPNPWDDGDISEYDAIELMRQEAIITLIKAEGSEVEEVYSWLINEAFMIL